MLERKTEQFSKESEAQVTSYSKKNSEDAYKGVIKTALRKDDKKVLQRVAEVKKELLLNYHDPISEHNIFQEAMQEGASLCLQYLLTEFPEHRAVRDSEGNSLVQQAVMRQQFAALDYLLSDRKYELEKDINNNGESIFDLARRVGVNMLQYLYKKFDARTMDLFPRTLDRASFLEKQELGIKGFALMLHYYVEKNPDAPEVCIYHYREADKGAKEIARIFDLFVRSNSQNLLIYCNNDSHSYVYKCEKFQGQAYIIILDSIAIWMDDYHVIPEMRASYPESLAKLKFLNNDTTQQTAPAGCRYYALKNISMLMKRPDFYKELSEENYLIVNDRTVEKIPVCAFFLPARFMRLATSPEQLQLYVTRYPEEAKKTVRITKEMVPENMMQYCLHKRNRFNMKTPELVRNYLYDPKNKESKESEFIQKNNSIWYFKKKYIEYALDLQLSKFSPEELAKLLAYYDARNLEFDDDTHSIVNRAIIRSKSGENTFIFQPRSEAPRTVAETPRTKRSNTRSMFSTVLPGDEEKSDTADCDQGRVVQKSCVNK